MSIASNRSNRPMSGLPLPNDELDGFIRLDVADDAADDAEHAAFGATRDEPGGGGSGYQQR